MKGREKTGTSAPRARHCSIQRQMSSEIRVARNVRELHTPTCPKTKHQSSMQTVKSREPETAQVPEPPEEKPEGKPGETARYQPGKAAILSLIPGLGHFYVGQPVVGSLVLVSSFLGLTFLATIVAGKSLFQSSPLSLKLSASILIKQPARLKLPPARLR